MLDALHLVTIVPGVLLEVHGLSTSANATTNSSGGA